MALLDPCGAALNVVNPGTPLLSLIIMAKTRLHQQQVDMPPPCVAISARNRQLHPHGATPIVKQLGV
jgi:hypothetical protein